MRKKVCSVLLALVMVLGLAPGTGVFVVKAEAAGNYDAQRAIDYARNHWNDGVGLCAEFVSNCIRQGGCSAWSASSSTLFSLLKGSGMGTMYQLVRNSDATISQSNNAGMVAPGDPIFFYCPYETDGKPYVHVSLCSSVDSSGLLHAYQHNTARNDALVNMSKCGYCGGRISAVYAYHFDTTPPHADIGTDFYAYIINLAPWKHLENAPGSPGNVQLAAEGNNNYDLRQIWRFERQSDGSYVIINQYDNSVLDANNYRTENGTNVEAYWHRANTANQRWFIRSYSDGYEIVTAQNDYSVLDVAGGGTAPGTNVQLWEPNGTAAQRFSIYKLEYSPISADIGNIFYAYILNTEPWTPLENTGSNVEIGENRAGDRFDPKRIWKFERHTDGSYVILNEYDGKCLDAFGVSTANGTNVYTYPWTGNMSQTNQRWYIRSHTNGYEIATVQNGTTVLDVLNGSTAPGTNIQLYAPNGSAAQRFSIWHLDWDGIEPGINYKKPAKPAAPVVSIDGPIVAGKPFTVQWTESPLKDQYFDQRTYNLGFADKNGNLIEAVTMRGLTGTSATVTLPDTSAASVWVSAVNAKYADWRTQGQAIPIQVLEEQPFSITTQPQNTTVTAGYTATIPVEATGEGLTYQWYTKNPNQSRFYKSSVISDTYSVTATEKMSGRQLYCVITDANGETLTTDTVTLTVEKPAPSLAIVTQPQSVTVAPGEVAAITVEAAGEGLTYQWYTKNANQSRFYKSSVTNDSYSVTATEKMSGRQLYCVITDADRNTLTTDTVTLTVEKPVVPLAIVTQPQSLTVGPGETAVIPVEAAGEGLTYQWYTRNPNQSRFYKSTLTGDTYTVTASARMSGRQLYCVVRDAGGETVQTDTVTLTVG